MKRIVFVITFLAFASLTLAAPPARTQQPLSDYETVRRSMQFSFGPVGVGGDTSPTETSFRNLLRSPTATQDFRKLLSDATTVGQLYALLGLKLLHDPEYAAVAPRYKVSRSQVSFAGGCVTSLRPVAEIAKYIDSVELK